MQNKSTEFKKKQDKARKIARGIPNSIEAEQAILACLLIDEESAEKFLSRLNEDDFYSNAHKIIINAMKEVYRENLPIDFVTITDKLEKQAQLETVGGLDYITTLTTFLPSASNYKHYLDIVKNNTRLRSVIRAGQDISENGFEVENGNDALSFAEKEIFDLSQKEDVSELTHVEVGLKKVIDKFDAIAKDSSILRGIPTGFDEFDAITNGLQNSDLILLAARPGVGKTSFAMNLITHAAVVEGRSCAVFSLEMPMEQVVQRSLCSIACVNMGKALKGTLNDEEWQRLWVANKKLKNSKIFIDDSALNTPTSILSKCRRLKRQHGLDLVMIDYLGLMKSEKDYDNRTLEIGEITRTLKIAAKELNVPIILLSQLNRMVEQRNDHHPMLSDLRDSGSIEQDADIVLFIYNPEKHNDAVSEDAAGICDIEIAKHRNGQTGTIKLRWVGEWVTFVNKNFRFDNRSPQRTADGKDEEIQNLDEVKQVFANSPAESEAYANNNEEENVPPPTDEDAPPFDE